MIDRINLILKAKNLTAKQFAKEIGVQPSGMSHILSGRNNPSLDFVMKVMKRYPEIDINWLMSGKGEMYAMLATPIPKKNTLLTDGIPTLFDNIDEPDASPFDATQEDLAPGQQQITHRENVVMPPSPVPTPSEAAGRSLASFENPCSRNHALKIPNESRPTTEDKNTIRGDFETPSYGNDSREDEKASASGRVNNNAIEHQKNDDDYPPVERKQRLLNVKKIFKVVVLYDDHTFSEYYPEGQ